MNAGRPKAYLFRRYRFSASHRLHSEALDERENRNAYGKCNNPHGHGHNYVIEVCFSGAVESETGMVTNLADLDAFAREHLLHRFQWSNLNEDPAFAGTVPTTENLLLEIERLFQGYPQGRLERVRIEETSNNSFATAGHAAPVTGEKEPQ